MAKNSKKSGRAKKPAKAPKKPKSESPRKLKKKTHNAKARKKRRAAARARLVSKITAAHKRDVSSAQKNRLSGFRRVPQGTQRGNAPESGADRHRARADVQTRIRELIKLAKEQGYLTFDDLNEALPDGPDRRG